MPGKSHLDPRKVGTLSEAELNVRPLQDQVLFRFLPRPETAAGIILPESSRKEDKLWEAEVIAVGPGAWHDGAFDSNFVRMELKPGDRILVKADAGWQIGPNRMARVGAVEGVLES